MRLNLEQAARNAAENMPTTLPDPKPLDKLDYPAMIERAKKGIANSAEQLILVQAAVKWGVLQTEQLNEEVLSDLQTPRAN